LEVTVIAPDRVPLERVLGAELGVVYRDLHRDHGVRMLLGTGVAVAAIPQDASSSRSGCSKVASSQGWE
jgi:hypothetical protein